MIEISNVDKTLLPIQYLPEEAITVNLEACPTGIGEAETREQIMLPIAWQVKSACCLHSLYGSLVEKDRSDAKANTHQSKHSYTFVDYYGQKMEMPCFECNHQAIPFLFTCLSVYNIGVMDCAHVLSGETDPKDHMHCHVCYEGVASKRANNVVSLILKTSTDANIICENVKGGELNILFDNCSGQNKNNTFLRLAPYMVELGCFKSINFVFLVVGHTKNSADMLLNNLKN